MGVRDRKRNLPAQSPPLWGWQPPSHKVLNPSSATNLLQGPQVGISSRRRQPASGFFPGIRRQCRCPPTPQVHGELVPLPRQVFLARPHGLRRAGSPTHPGGLAPGHLRCKTTCSWGPGAVLQTQPGFPATCDASVPHDVFLLTPEGRAESVPGAGTSSNQPETKRSLLRDVLWGEDTGHWEKEKALYSLLTPSDSNLHVGVRVRGSGRGADSLHPLSRAEH